jgi:hypothetical protein
MGETRRGRISHATYVRTVGQMLTRDWFALDRGDVLTQLEIVGQLVAAYPNRFLSPGWAVRALLDKAMDDVMAAARKSKDGQGQRIAQFLELRRQEQTVTDIAKAWELSRECVSRTISRKAILLVTDRFLLLSKASLSDATNGPKQRSATSVEREKQGA